MVLMSRVFSDSMTGFLSALRLIIYSEVVDDTEMAVKENPGGYK